MKNFTAALTAVLTSTAAFAHDGHGSGIGHDMQHALWLSLAVVAGGVATVAFVLRKAKKGENRIDDGM